uniref:Uncharacterized protein n=1 Tax=viral metagenome TaxID=1070528 RepID=A0A6M3LW20_9ZZZZ
MERKDAKIGAVVQLAGRTATIIKVKGNKASVRPVGESARWVQIDDLVKSQD